MLLRIIFGGLFILAGVVVGGVSYFGSMFDSSGAPPPWDAYAAALVAIGVGVAIIVWK